MTIEEKSMAYAEKRLRTAYPNTDLSRLDKIVGFFDTYDMAQAYEDGATEALASQWKDPKVELPEDDRQVLVETDCKDKELRHTIAYFLAGGWHFPDDWYFGCRVLRWLYIPPVKGGSDD